MNIKERISTAKLRTHSDEVTNETSEFCEKDVFVLTGSVKEKLKQAIEAGKNIVIEIKTGETRGITISCIDNIIPAEDSNVIFIDNEEKNKNTTETIKKTDNLKPNKYKLLKDKIKKKRELEIQLNQNN